MSRRRLEDATPAEIPKAQRIRWWLAMVLALAALGAVVYGLYLPANSPLASLLVARSTISSVITRVALQVAAIVVFAVFALFFIGKARLERAAYRADRIRIDAFAEHRESCGDDPSAAVLTAHFTKILNTSRLYTPSAVPGVGSSYDFLQIVENAGEAADGWWKVAARLVRLVQPPAAFQVSASVWSAPHGRCRLVLELVRIPRFAASPIVIEDDTWMHVLHQAANAVAAFVLPRSRYGRTNIYWTAWRDAAIPYRLFDYYQRATWLVTQRRYDEALAAYHAALDHDPSNVYIRLEIASVQEKLDLHLDALVTYDDVITICSQGRRRLATWWKVTPSPQRSSRRVRRQQDVALLVARYRHALVLGLGDALASTWWPTLPAAPIVGDARVRQRATLRRAVRVRFARYLEPTVTGGGWCDVRRVGGAYDDLLSEDVVELDRSTPDSVAQCQRDRRERLRSYLCGLSQFEIERLIADCRFIRLLHWIRWRRMSRVLPMNALRLCLVWIVLRRAMADVDRQTGEVRRPPVGTTRWRPRVPDLFPNDHWPPDPEQLTKAVHRMSLFGRRHRRSWTACYNAACVYAVAMMNVGRRGAPDPRWRAPSDEALTGDDRDTVACRAVNELYHATTVSHTGWLAAHQSWLLEEDPDIDALRDHELFQVFEMVTFAPTGPARIRPHRAHVWEQVAYVSRLVHDIATYRAQFWRAKAHEEPPDDHTVAGWRADDCRAWADLRALAVSRRDWSSRNTAVVASRLWARHAGRLALIYGFPPHRATIAPAYCSYLREPNTPLTTRDAVESAVLGYIDHCDGRLNELVRRAAALSRDGTLPAALPVPARLRTTRYRRECERRRALWAELAAGYDDHDHSPDRAPA